MIKILAFILAIASSVIILILLIVAVIYYFDWIDYRVADTILDHLSHCIILMLFIAGVLLCIRLETL